MCHYTMLCKYCKRGCNFLGAFFFSFNFLYILGTFLIKQLFHFRFLDMNVIYQTWETVLMESWSINSQKKNDTNICLSKETFQELKATFSSSVSTSGELYNACIFPSVTRFWNYNPLFQVWSIFPSVTNFSKSDLEFHVLSMFSSVTHVSMCDPVFQKVTTFLKSDPFFEVKHFPRCDHLFKVWPIFPSVTHFLKSDPFFQLWSIFQVWRILPSVSHQVLPIFLSVAHFLKLLLFF